MLFPFWIDMAVPMFMIVSGYVNALSFARKGLDSFEDCYSLNSLVSKFLRLTVPFVFVVLLEIIGERIGKLLLSGDGAVCVLVSMCLHRNKKNRHKGASCLFLHQCCV